MKPTIEQRFEAIIQRLKELEETIEFLTKDMEGCTRCGSLDLSTEAQQLTDEPTCQRCIDGARG